MRHNPRGDVYPLLVGEDCPSQPIPQLARLRLVIRNDE